MFNEQEMMNMMNGPQAEMIDQLESEYIYSEIFRAFDVEG